MRKLTFTSEESSFIAKAIAYGIGEHMDTPEYKEGVWGIEKRYILPLEKLAAKVSKGGVTFLGPKEVSFLHCTLNFYPLRLQHGNDELFWLELTDEQLQKLKDFDTRKDVLAKTGYYKIKSNSARCDVDFRFRQVIETVEKLKTAQTILLRKNHEGIFYRIAFIHDGHGLMTFKFRQGLALQDERFGSLCGSSPEVYATNRQYTHIVKRHQALDLLQGNSFAGSDSTKNFFLKVLSAQA